MVARVARQPAQLPYRGASKLRIPAALHRYQSRQCVQGERQLPTVQAKRIGEERRRRAAHSPSNLLHALIADASDERDHWTDLTPVDALKVRWWRRGAAAWWRWRWRGAVRASRAASARTAGLRRIDPVHLPSREGTVLIRQPAGTVLPIACAPVGGFVLSAAVACGARPPRWGVLAARRRWYVHGRRRGRALAQALATAVRAVSGQSLARVCRVTACQLLHVRLTRDAHGDDLGTRRAHLCVLAGAISCASMVVFRRVELPMTKKAWVGRVVDRSIAHVGLEFDIYVSAGAYDGWRWL